MSKASGLQKIADQITRCRICKKGKIGKPVPGEGNPKAKIVFLGEAPGKEEAKVGRPFVGRSGKLLRSLIREIGLREKDVFITSPVKYLPKYGTPKKSDIAHGRTHLLKQLAIIQPKIIVLLGNVAAEALSGKEIPAIYFKTCHPAAALRFPKYREMLKKDFRKLQRVIRDRR